MSKQTAKGRRSLTAQSQNAPGVPMTPTYLSRHILRARERPFHGCWIMSSWDEGGMTPVVVARQQDDGRIVFANFLVDLHCLGIKNVMCRTDYSVKHFERELPSLCSDEPEQCSVELAHEVVYGALEYAAKLGFEPHRDFYLLGANLLLDPPDVHPRTNGVTFGNDGKPLYVSGPHDTQAVISSVMRTLRRTCGEGNFDYIIGLGSSDDIDA